MAKLIYIVTSGCYSDYSIRAVFSSREKAQAMIDDWKARKAYWVTDEPSIEEWVLDEQACPEEGRRRINVVLAENGDTIRVSDKLPDGEPIGNIVRWHWFRSPDPKMHPWIKEERRGILFEGTIWARDEDHAVKIARDVRAASIAAGELDRVRNDPSKYQVLLNAAVEEDG